MRPSQTTSCSDRLSPVHLPHPASSLVLSAPACFPHLVNRPFLSFVYWRATCSTSDLPGGPSLPSTRFHYPFNRPTNPLHYPSCVGPLLSQIFGSTKTREGYQGCGANPKLRNQMLCPCQTVWRHLVLWTDRESETRIPKKRLHNHI